MRLKKSWQFRKVYDEGAKVVCDCAVVFYLQNPIEDSGPVFGVVASKRVGNAVKRNRAKRLLRETSRGLSGKLNHQNIWVVLVARAQINEYSCAEVQNEVGNALKRAHLITR
jgi:ribonuclease P protein component